MISDDRLAFFHQLGFSFIFHSADLGLEHLRLIALGILADAFPGTVVVSERLSVPAIGFRGASPDRASWPCA